MEFKIPVIDFQNIASKLAMVAKPNSDSMGDLILIEANDVVRFSANDKNISLSIVSRTADVTTPGKAVCRLGDIKGYISRFVPLSDDYGTDSFAFVVKNGVLFIKTKTIFRDSKPSYRKLTVPTSNVSEYPNIKIVNDAQLIINSNTLKDGINSVLHCVNPNEIRAAFCGVGVSVKNDKIVFVATNGVKLSEAVFNINVVNIRELSHIFKYSFASILKTVLDPDSQVFITFEGSNVYVRCNDVYIVGSLLVNDSFPDYKKAFANYDKVVTLPRLSFVDNITNVTDALNVEDNSRLSIIISGNKIMFKGERVEIEQEFDEPFEHELNIDVNGHYLADLVAGFVGDVVNLCFVDSDTPIIIKSAVNDEHTALLTHLRRR